MLCVINVNKATELEFKLQVQGSAAKSIEPRFIIIGKEFAVVCLCKPEGDVIKVNIPKLEGILPLGKYNIRFEVLVGDQIYVPIKDEIELRGRSTLGDPKQEEKPVVAASFEDATPKSKVKEAVETSPIIVESEHTHEHKHIEEVASETVITEQVEEIISEPVPMPVGLKLMQAVQNYTPPPPPPIVIPDYVAEVMKRNPTAPDGRAYSLIQKLTK